MMKTCRFLAFDLGATSGRAVLGTQEGKEFRMEEVHRFPNAVVCDGGKYYWDIEALFGELKVALRKVAGMPLDSIGIDTWGVDFGCLGADGRLLDRPRAYRDPYTDGIPEEVFKTVPRGELYAATGIQVMPFNTLFQLVAQMKEPDGPLRRAREVLFMPDLLSWMLTGERVCEYTIASTSHLINPRTRQFDAGLMKRLGLDPGWFRPMVAPGTRIGFLKEEIARETGMERVPVVAVAGHDTASAVAAVPAENENFAYLSSGTWSLMGIETPAPILTEEACAQNFTNEGGLEGTTRFLKNITGMWLLEQCRAAWAAQGRRYDYDTLARMAQESRYAGTVSPDDPRFAHPTDMPQALCAVLEESGAPRPETDADLVRSIYRSLTSRYREVLGLLQRFAPFSIRKLHVIGGGAASELMSQWTADALGIPVVAGPVEATAIGNLMVQAQARGLFRDRWEMRRALAEAVRVQVYQPKEK